MKVKPLTIVFIISLALNIAGIVFTALYFQTRSKVGKLKKENAELKLSHSASPLPDVEKMKEPGSNYRHDFVSLADGEPDSFLVSPPAATAANTRYTLVVYLHGLNGDYGEPFLIPQRSPFALIVRGEMSNAVLASLSYRKASSWGNVKAIEDINQNIREMMNAYPVDNIIISGTSMGGTTALAYAANAPDDIKKSIVAVVSVEGAGDLAALYGTTESAPVKESIAAAMGGKPDEKPEAYKQASLIPNLSKLNREIRIALVTATRDRVMPGLLTEQLVGEFKKRNVHFKNFTVDSQHEPPPVEYYREALRYALTPSP